MNALLAVLIAVVGVPVFDRIAMYRVGLFASNCDYRYWPLSRSRKASVILLFVAAAALFRFAPQQRADPPAWLLSFGVAALVLWLIVGVIDIIAQDRQGYRAPPQRYSDPEF